MNKKAKIFLKVYDHYSVYIGSISQYMNFYTDLKKYFMYQK